MVRTARSPSVANRGWACQPVSTPSVRMSWPSVPTQTLRPRPASATAMHLGGRAAGNSAKVTHRPDASLRRRMRRPRPPAAKPVAPSRAVRATTASTVGCGSAVHRAAGHGPGRCRLAAASTHASTARTRRVAPAWNSGPLDSCMPLRCSSGCSEEGSSPALGKGAWSTSTGMISRPPASAVSISSLTTSLGSCSRRRLRRQRGPISTTCTLQPAIACAMTRPKSSPGRILSRSKKTASLPKASARLATMRPQISCVSSRR